jgi:HAD superfamily hydrolase (TIGR01450 family)
MSTSPPQPPSTLAHSHQPIHYVLVDLSGTLHVGDCPIPGAVEALNRLVSACNDDKSMIKGVLFLTNTTTVARQTLFDSLRSEALGFSASITDINQIMTSAQAVEHYVMTHNLHPYCLVENDMLLDLPFFAQQQQHQTQQVDEKDNDSSYYDSVLVGLSPSSFQYEPLNRAFRILHRMKEKDLREQEQQPPHRLLCFHQSKHVKSSRDGELSLGPGGFVKCLEHTTDYSALVLGKPSMGFFHAAMSKLLLQSSSSAENGDTMENDDDDEKAMATILRENVVMVGDDVVNDIVGARDAGIRHLILVQTGKYQAGDEKKVLVQSSNNTSLDDDKSNLLVKPSIVEAVDYILKHNDAFASAASAATLISYDCLAAGSIGGLGDIYNGAVSPVREEADHSLP